MPAPIAVLRQAGALTALGSLLLLTPLHDPVAGQLHQLDRATPAKHTTPAPSRLRSISVPVEAAPAAAAARGAQSSDQTFALPARRTGDFGLVGVTWDRQAGSGTVRRVQVRTRTQGRWSRWSSLDVDHEAGESTTGRQGTEPLWAGNADGVAVRLHSAGGPAPRGVSVDLVTPGTGPSGDAAPAAALVPGATTTAPTFTPMPRYVSRAAWGARPASGCDSPRYGSHSLGVIFHHTVNSNAYTAAQSAGIVRAIQTYHMGAQGWCDIGYNFLVDKYGQVFEGRAGGARMIVRGAHAGNFDVNTYAMGVSMIGNLDTAAPSPAMKDAAVRLIGWWLATHYLPAKGGYSLDGHTLQRISGHRDVHLNGFSPSTSTSCPGRYGYAWLTSAGGLRDQVAAYIAGYTTPIKTRATALGQGVTGWVTVGERATAGGRRGDFTNGLMFSKAGLPTTWVSGPIESAYVTHGAQTGSLGFPTHDASTAANGTVTQTFEHGTIRYNPATRTTTVS